MALTKGHVALIDKYVALTGGHVASTLDTQDKNIQRALKVLGLKPNYEKTHLRPL